jgi:hypothetical protein
MLARLKLWVLLPLAMCVAASALELPERIRGRLFRRQRGFQRLHGHSAGDQSLHLAPLRETGHRIRVSHDYRTGKGAAPGAAR